jgi:hypothetical protein
MMIMIDFMQGTIATSSMMIALCVIFITSKLEMDISSLSVKGKIFTAILGLFLSWSKIVFGLYWVFLGMFTMIWVFI